MIHRIDDEDRRFMARVEACTFPVDAFDHEAHVRLAYIYLVLAGSTDAATGRMRGALLALLQQAGIDPATKSADDAEAPVCVMKWRTAKIQAVVIVSWYFVDRNPRLLDSRIMQTHYSTDLLFSAAARNAFVEPDRADIPRHREHR